MENNILASESFFRGRRVYFLDFKQAENSSHYISFTLSESQADGSYKRNSFRFWEEDFGGLVGCLSSLLLNAAHHGKQWETVQDIRQHKKQQAISGIKALDADLRPREKMLEKGTVAMENCELLAMLIGSGTPDETAIDLSQRILDSVGGKLTELAQLDYARLCRFAGMGIAKSSSIMAAMELARRFSPYFHVRPFNK